MRKAKKTSFSTFWFVFISIVGVVFSQECNDSGGFFEHNSTYAANRELIFISLAFNVTQHGFYSSSIGKVPDQVYAMGMCTNGSEQAVCSECINIAVEQLKYNCRNQTGAFTWAPHKTLCFARYSNSSFYGRSDEHPHYTEYSSVGIKSYLGAFESNWTGAMDRMITTKKNKGSFSNRNDFSVEKLKLENLPALYGLMQCTPDLNSDECGKCLEMSVGSYREGKSRGKQGGTIAYPSCIFRWDLYPFSGAFNPKCEKISKGMIVAFVGPVGVIISVLSAAVAVLVCRRRKTDAPDESPSTNSLQYDLKTIEVATCTFSRSNILGQGGFGEVFKGVLQDGSEIAVKRLSTESAQGVQEFKNETSLVTKLQHRNLVRVLGFCMEGEEKILIYEFVPNKSLDHFLFEPTITKQGQLDWAKRYKIIFGTAKGILYLHNDAPLRIIHRDLKASNILLDADMKPKVADFGMARILEIDQSRADTRRVVGTIGYISPEYMMHGQFSTKSDVYSFGVLILEIISGKRNSNFHDIDDSGNNLVTHAWKHWKNGSPLELVDAEIGKNYQSNEVTRCIHIALLCVQNDPKDRPNISDIISMLNSNSTTLAVPQSPGYEGMEMALPPINSVNISINDSLVNDLVPR